jgi:hypothetical protein
MAENSILSNQLKIQMGDALVIDSKAPKIHDACRMFLTTAASTFVHLMLLFLQ